MYSLKPLSGKRKKKKPHAQFGVYDIESSNWKDHVVSAFYTKSEDGFEILEFFKSVDQFLDFCFDENPCSEIYCHFGGIFDFLFILGEVMFKCSKYELESLIPRGSGILLMKIRSVKNNRVATFRDSGALLPFGLESITKNFGVENVKGEIDRTSIKNDTPEVRKYLEGDVKGLWQSLEKMKSWGPIKEAGMKTTVASQAVQILRKYLIKEIPSLSEGYDSFIRKAYYGGRTEIFKPLYDLKSDNSPLHYYDINSLYPYVMANNNFPTTPKLTKQSFDFEKDVGYVNATVIIPKNIYIPMLPVMFEINGTNKLIFPVGEVTGTWASCELKYALGFGVKVKKIHKAVIFEEPWPVFKSFINDMYKIRLSAPKESVDNVLAKLMMNSCYGRFGLNLTRECVDTTGGLFLQNSKPWVFHREDGLSKSIFRYEDKIRNTFSNVSIAAWVTALARIENHKVITSLKDNVYYTDTDSFFTPIKRDVDDKLGGLKLEYELSRACFLLPKTYIIEAPTEIFTHKTKAGAKMRSRKKLTMKGFDKDEVLGIGFNDFVTALEGDLRRMKVVTPKKLAKMKAAFRTGEALKVLKESTRGINSIYDKRKIIKVNGQYDTVPWVIEKNKIINMEENYEQNFRKPKRALEGANREGKFFYDEVSKHPLL